jgi:hypothetical protein
MLFRFIASSLLVSRPAAAKTPVMSLPSERQPWPNKPICQAKQPAAAFPLSFDAMADKEAGT